MKEQISYYENEVERRKKLKMFEERLDILEALLWAAKHFNQIMFLMTTAENVADAKKQLEDKYRFNKMQAEMIVNMRIRQFTKEEIEDFEKKEVEECRNKVDFYKQLISKSEL